MLKISEMTEGDIKFAARLTQIEKWWYKEEDFKRLIFFEPRGCFIAWKDGERIGMITTTSYGDYAFLGCLIVREEERGEGVGEKLMKHAIEYLREKEVKTIELDGVFPAVSLYRRLGFKDKYLSLRFKRESKESNPKMHKPISQYKEDMIGKIVNFDGKKAGILRERILRKFLEEFKDSVYAVGDKEISSYGIVRERVKGCFTIGPIIAESRGTAGELLSAIILDYEKKVLTIGIPEINFDMIDLVLKKGFVYNEPSLRMYLGKRRNYEKFVFAILAPEKG